MKYYGGSLKNLILRGGSRKKQYIERLPIKRAETVGDLRERSEKEGGVFEGG